MKKNNLIYALGLVPLLMAQDYGSAIDPVTVNTLPKCADNEYLVYSGGGVVCQTIAGGSLQLPNCDADMKILTSQSNGDAGGGIACTTKGTTSLGNNEITAITQMQTDITQIGTTIQQIKTNPPGSASLFQGVTAPTANGAISSNGLTGIRAAADLCAAKFGTGAHMCTTYDMYLSIATAGQNVANKFDPSQNLAKAWVYAESWNNPIAAPQEPTAGLGENCAGYTYPTGNLHWTGTAVAWEIVTGTSKFGPKFFGGTDAPCNVGLPIACCK